ncbi:CapA family protein [Paenibacillus senegalensis]|uniref:CapA family protein n=1 Tax=Paenibacillus senegalensis TaxID=1465766 RepID=UPI000287DA3C|nr:CapA family protein [Paenibacillus senegalensis]
MQKTRTARILVKKKKSNHRLLKGAVYSLFLLIVVIIGTYVWMNRDTLPMGEEPGDPANAGISQPSPEPAPTPDPSHEPSLEPSEAPENEPEEEPAAEPDPSGAENEEEEGVSQQGQQGTVTISFVGDVLLGSTVENLLKQYGYDYPYQDVRSLLQASDFTVANLETPITDRGTPEEEKSFVYRSSPEVLPAFKEAGFDLVSLANNHMMDYGVIGLLDTLDHLDKNGIHRVGAGRDVEEAFRPFIWEEEGLRIAFLNFTRVVPSGDWKAGHEFPEGLADTYNHTKPVEAIANAKEEADLVIVLAHWGEERMNEPNETQKELARRFIDAGADLIIGSHPHVLQGFEQYKGKWIAYSLGNFIFTTREDAPQTLESAILEAACSAEGCDLRMIPIFTQWAKPVVMEDEQGQQLFRRISDVSPGAEILEDGRIVTR